MIGNCKSCKIDCFFSGEDFLQPICKWYSPITNADRIRSMSDEELGEFLGEWAERSLAWKRDGLGECLAWLQEPISTKT